MSVPQKVESPINLTGCEDAEMLLQARNIAKSFNGVLALKDGRIDLRAGTIHALCGANGADSRRAQQLEDRIGGRLEIN